MAPSNCAIDAYVATTHKEAGFHVTLPLNKAAMQRELVSRISTFRPSDRSVLSVALESSELQDVALDALKAFVREWESADWLEAYSLERVGRWLAKYHPEKAQTMSKWVRGSISSPSSIKETAARDAFRKGLKAKIALNAIA